jgi:hypothetical protein
MDTLYAHTALPIGNGGSLVGVCAHSETVAIQSQIKGCGPQKPRREDVTDTKQNGLWGMGGPVPNRPPQALKRALFHKTRLLLWRWACDSDRYMESFQAVFRLLYICMYLLTEALGLVHLVICTRASLAAEVLFLRKQRGRRPDCSGHISRDP